MVGVARLVPASILVSHIVLGAGSSGAAPPSPSPPALSPSPSPATSSPPLATPSPSPSPRALPAARAAAVEAALAALRYRLEIPGLSAAVVMEGEPAWSGALGLADLENEVPATAETVYRLASVSKPITATAVLQLSQEGRLDLDAPIQRYVSTWPEKPWPVTARRLLCHQSGIRNWTEEEFRNTRRFGSIFESLVPFKDDALLFEPGTQTLYSSLGYDVLGAAVEAVSGRTYIEHLRTSVLEPAGMTSTRDDDVLAIIPRRAHGYQRRGEVLANSSLSDTSNRVPGGGLCGTASDLARFAAAIQGGRLLRRETLALALTPQRLRSGRVTGYGLGWALGRTGGQPEAYHVGGQPRVSSVLYMQPEAALAIVILANLEGVERELLEAARGIAGLVK